MGVYIDMEMPKSCWSCRMFCNCFACEGYDCHCAALGKGIGTEAEVPRNKRRDDCPLLPVPPHGRLVDADKMRESIRRQAGLLKLMGGELSDLAETLEKGFLQEIANAPTIIPAEPCNNLSKPCKEDEP